MAIPYSHVHPESGPAASDAHATSGVVLAAPADGAAVGLPSASLISDGTFSRAGSDLKIVDPDGNEVVVQGYFAGDSPPDLMSPGGSQYLTPQLVDSFLSSLAPGQYAQAAPSAVATPIGQVLDLDGDATALRADGSRAQLAKGDPVYEGDVIETGGGNSAIRMVFTDHTEFSLGTDARLALDQLVFNPDTQAGSAQFSVLKGIFIFASGQIAKSDNTDMTVSTPVATIGIRGTEVAGRVVDGDSQFTIIDGAIEVTTRAGSVTLDSRGETTQVTGNDALPSDPVVLTPAQFGQAYGEVSGVVSDYFSQPQPGTPGMDPGGNAAPPDSGGGQPETAPSDSSDRADAGSGTIAGSTLLASTLPSDAPTVAGLSDPVSLAAAFAGEPSTIDLSPTLSPVAVPITDVTGGLPTAGSVGVFTGAGQAGAASGSAPEETIIAVAPGLDLADAITFDATGDATGDQTGGAAGFSLVPSAGAPAGSAGGGAPATVQVSFSPVPGGADNDGSFELSAGDDVSSGSPPLDVPSSGSSGSPFRGESGATDPFAGNPYVAQPFGYAGPQLGDAIFDLVAGNSSNSNGGGGIGIGDPDTADAVPGFSPAQDTGPGQAEQGTVTDITLIVSNATNDQKTQDLTHSYELPNHGNGSFVLIGGDEMGLPGVADSAQIELARDASGNVDVVLASAWDSVKNIRAESDGAGDIRIENFVHADVQLGDGGDSELAIIGAKRGFITTGDGNDRIAVDAVSNGAGWSNRFELDTGAGNDTVVFDGASNGLSELVFVGGDGTDTLQLTGPGQSFDLSTGQVQIAGVERIDISGASDATLSVPSDLVQGLDDAVNPLTRTTQTLVVDGDAGDTVDLVGNDWAEVETTQIDGQGYTVYEHSDGMRVAADSDMQVA